MVDASRALEASDVEPEQQPRVSLVVIATGRYDRFIPDLVDGARTHVVGLANVFVLSDRPVRHAGTVWLPWGHLPWPYPTLLRYRAIAAYESVLKSTDVLVYVDVDMRFERRIDWRQCEGLLAVLHPGFVEKDEAAFPYERRVQSRAAIPSGAGKAYYAGGVQGGRAETYLEATRVMASWVQADLENDLVPVWHDESVWNRFCLEQPPEMVLPPTFCSPEHEGRSGAYITALDKNHDELRQTPIRARLHRVAGKIRQRGWRAVTATVRKLGV